MADSRLHSIYFHAGRLFNTKRYANVKVSEIAAASGIATGTIYNLFSSKKAILTFVIRASLDKEYLYNDIELPVVETDMNLLLALCSRMNERIIRIMQITDDSKHIVKNFPQLITELFDLHADILLGTNNIEHNANVLCELAEVFFLARENFFKDMENIMNLYMEAGEIRHLDHVCFHIQSINDILTWWAMNAYIAMPNVSIPRETARAIAVDLVARAYLTDYQ